jgi:hypothetical protein
MVILTKDPSSQKTSVLFQNFTPNFYECESAAEDSLWVNTVIDTVRSKIIDSDRKLSDMY